MKKWLSFVLLFAAVLMTNVLVSCGDDNNDVKTTVAGTYTGTDSLHFGMMGAAYKTAAENVKYTITENSNGTINVMLPQETYDFTATVPMVGKIVQGSYTVKNIPFDKAKNAYYLDYSYSDKEEDADKNVSVHVSISGMKIDKNYDLTVGQITVIFAGSTVTVVNVHKFGNMPMPLTATFIGTK